MKSTGIVRKVDELGRIVLPIEMRRTLDIAEKDDIIVLAGKGHETSQDIGGHKNHLDEREEVRDALLALRNRHE